MFHQIEGVRLLNDHELFRLWNSRRTDTMATYYEGELFEHAPPRTKDKQECHTMDAVKYLEIIFKSELNLGYIDVLGVWIYLGEVDVGDVAPAINDLLADFLT